MKYDSPFDLGDKVYHIRRRPVTSWEDCPLCEGQGTVRIGIQSRTCPDCYGRKGVQRFEQEEWQVCKDTFEDNNSGRLIIGGPSILTIGQIRLEADKKKTEWVAMCHETGVGSGTLHKMADMFKTVEEAEHECEKRNS